jgi:glucose/arabinose dehydrogenase
MNSRMPLFVAFTMALGACGGSGDGNGNRPPPVPNPTDCATGIETPRAFSGLDFASPVAMKQAPNEPSRWFVVEQGGRIRAFENDPGVDTAVDFIDLTSRVHESGEAGLLGMAFHPDFANNGRVYLNFSELVDGDLRSVTAEFTSADGGQTLDPASERLLLTVPKDFENHNGGNVEFGPDGYLYIGLGDGGGSGDPDGNAQNPRSLLGKMLRIDVNARPRGAPYSVPTGADGNPFAANPLCDADNSNTQACPEIFALGLRNPWRWSFDRQTDELWAGDVGQNNWEEIDVIVRGGNYGWDVREGAHCFEPASGCPTAGLTDPVAEYDHGMGFSITGGYVYRGGQATEHAGRYVFGDFGGMIAALAPDGSGGFEIEELATQGCTPEGASGPLRISSFAEDLDGELYLLDYFRGELLRLVFTQ